MTSAYSLTQFANATMQEGELAAQAQQDAQLQELQAKMNELEIQKLEIQVGVSWRKCTLLRQVLSLRSGITL